MKHQDAQDQTQIFLSRLIQRNSLVNVDADQGRLRAYLLSAFQNQWINQWQHDNAGRRGGDMQTVSLDMMDAETRFAHEHHDSSPNPETRFDRAWALALINACLADMASEDQSDGQGEAFTILRPFLNPLSVADACMADSASRLGLTDLAVHQRIFRLRAKFSKLLRTHVAGSLADPTPEAIEEEMQSFATLSNDFELIPPAMTPDQPPHETARHDEAAALFTMAMDTAGEHPGDAIGPYTWGKVIDDGGFGRVWLATQAEPVRHQVALKILKPGMDTGEVVSRFREEWKLLALMVHPGIRPLARNLTLAAARCSLRRIDLHESQ